MSPIFILKFIISLMFIIIKNTRKYKTVKYVIPRLLSRLYITIKIVNSSLIQMMSIL